MPFSIDDLLCSFLLFRNINNGFGSMGAWSFEIMTMISLLKCRSAKGFENYYSFQLRDSNESTREEPEDLKNLFIIHYIISHLHLFIIHLSLY